MRSVTGWSHKARVAQEASAGLDLTAFATKLRFEVVLYRTGSDFTGHSRWILVGSIAEDLGAVCLGDALGYRGHRLWTILSLLVQPEYWLLL
jgi:hypothetical protein